MPPPLRNDQWPNGLPWLTKEQQERIDKANELYRVTCELLTLCQQHKILWSCENPGRSFMWQTTPFVELFRTTPYESTEMHHCMYGSSRRKLTRLIHNIPSFRQRVTTAMSTSHGDRNLTAPGPLLKRQPPLHEL